MPNYPPVAAFLIAALSVMAAMVARLSRLSLLCLTLARAAGWTAPLGSVRYQGSVRHAVGPRMSGDRSDSLSAEFERLAAARSGTVFGSAPDLLRERKLEHSWVLIFNAGQDDEGLYTLQGSEASVQQHGNDGTYVLAFEQHEEASRFAMLLQAQGFDMPTATEWPAEQLSEFCSSTEFGLGFVPHEALLVPPQLNYFDETAFEVVAKLQEVEEAYGADGAEVHAPC